MGNVSVSINSTHNFGDSFVRFVTVTMSNSYATNGDSVTVADLGVSTLDRISFCDNVDGYSLEYDYTNNKIKAYNGTTEASATTDLSSVIVKGIVFGT